MLGGAPPPQLAPFEQNITPATPAWTQQTQSGSRRGDSAMRLASLFTRQKLKALFTTPNRDDLLFLKGLVEVGQLKPVIERRYPLSEVGNALRHVGGRRSQGQTVIQIAS